MDMRMSMYMCMYMCMYMLAHVRMRAREVARQWRTDRQFGCNARGSDSHGDWACGGRARAV